MGPGAMTDVKSGSGESVITLDSDIEELRRLGPFLDAFCRMQNVPDETCSHLQVALEELVINAIKHGKCEPKSGAIRLAIRRDGDQVNAVFSDTGIGFNPLEAPPPDLTKSLITRPLGGLGIHLVRHLLPSIRYERRGGRNYLFFTKSVNPESGVVSPEDDKDADGNGDNPS